MRWAHDSVHAYQLDRGHMVQAAVADIGVGPTRERIRQAKFGIDGPEVTQSVDRRAHQIRDIWSDMRRRQQIDGIGEAAGRRFERHLELAYRGRQITPSYGQLMAEGTPASQLSAGLVEAEAARHVDYVTLHKRAREELPPKARLAVLMACDGHALEAIGRMVSGYAMPKQAAAAAVGVITTGLEILATHYRMRDP